MRVAVLLFVLSFITACQNSTESKIEPTEPTKTLSVVDSTQWSLADRQLNPLLNAYFDLKNALVEWDTTMTNQAGVQLKALADSLEADSSLPGEAADLAGSIAAETAGLLGESDITEKRRAFHMISQHMLPLLKSLSFKAQPVYQQTCPMAFNDTEAAFWLSNEREIVNPYLGKKHPKYVSGMLHCGELTDSLSAKR